MFWRLSLNSFRTTMCKFEWYLITILTGWRKKQLASASHKFCHQKGATTLLRSYPKSRHMVTDFMWPIFIFWRRHHVFWALCMRQFVRTDIITTTISHEWLEQSRFNLGYWNIHQPMYSCTEDPVRFWRSKIKARGHSRPSEWRSHCHPRRRWGAKVHLLVFHCENRQ